MGAEFIKPDIRKVVLALLLPVYATYTVIHTMAIPPAKGVFYKFIFLPVPPAVVYFLKAYNGLRSDIVYAHPILSAQERTLGVILNYVVPLLVNYFAACLIFWVVKRRKEPR